MATTNYEPLKPKFELDIIGMKVNENFNNTERSFTPPNGISEQLMFFIYVPCAKKNFRFVARNLKEKNSWVGVFRIAETANKYEKDVNRRNLGKVAPKWIPDDLCQYCCKCKSEFTTINRRHHCR